MVVKNEEQADDRIPDLLDFKREKQRRENNIVFCSAIRREVATR